MISYNVWIVDDEETIRDGVVMALETDYRVRGFGNAESAFEALPVEQPDLLLLDIGLPGMDGITALERLRKEYPTLLVIIITAYEDTDTVISVMKLGAHDYIIKPILMPGLRVTIRNALETIRLKKEVQALQERYLEKQVPCFIGESCAIRNVMDFIGRVARSPDTPILILGETGTGKELIAGAIHCKSPNFKGPMVTVNCAAIPSELLESELFGYEKGAFSGASASGKEGLIGQAENGTLFLDEVGDLSADAQAKLLRFLEAGEYYRVGGTRLIRTRTRVISATNKNLEKMVEAGTFRKDLYFRLGVIKVRIPALNERSGDILSLAEYFLCGFGRKFSRDFSGFSPDAESALLNHDWEGNVRELRNCIERGVLVGQEPLLKPEDLDLSGDHSRTGSGLQIENISLPPLTQKGVDIPAIQETIEIYYIQEALKMTGGNETQAARLLNLKAHALRYRKAKLNIDE